MQRTETGNVCIIMGSTHSNRVNNKNWRELAGRRVIEYTISNASHAGIYDEIVVSTDHTLPPKLASLVQRYNAKILYREPKWANLDVDTALARSLEKWESESGKRYETCTMLHGTSVFWLPSWMRVATRILRHGYRCDVDKRQVDRVVADVQGCYVFRLDRYLAPDFIFAMDHRGINLDINTEKDFSVAAHIMRHIVSGAIPYPVGNENWHDETRYLTTDTNRKRADRRYP